VKDLALVLVEQVHVGSLLKLALVPLGGILSFRDFNCTTQPGSEISIFP